MYSTNRITFEVQSQVFFRRLKFGNECGHNRWKKGCSEFLIGPFPIVKKSAKKLLSIFADDVGLAVKLYTSFFVCAMSEAMSFELLTYANKHLGDFHFRSLFLR